MKIEVFGKPNCPYCDMANKLLTNKGLEFSYVDVSIDSDAMAKIVADGAKTVPRVYIDGVCVGGFNELKGVV